MTPNYISCTAGRKKVLLIVGLVPVCRADPLYAYVDVFNLDGDPNKYKYLYSKRQHLSVGKA